MCQLTVKLLNDKRVSSGCSKHHWFVDEYTFVISLDVLNENSTLATKDDIYFRAVPKPWILFQPVDKFQAHPKENVLGTTQGGETAGNTLISVFVRFPRVWQIDTNIIAGFRM